MKIVHDYTEDTVTDIIEISSAIYIGDFAVRISFTDGTNQLVDFKPFLSKSLHRGITKYQDENLFKKFTIEGGNLNWNDYDLIFPLEDLYCGTIS